jgi:hypothetical protein
VHMVNTTSTPPKRRSRVTRGTKLLPTVRGDSHWGRIMKDVHDAALEHVGGASYASELQRLQCRRIAALEAELVHLENKIGEVRSAGQEPSDKTLDLYCRLGSAQRRHCEALGWARTARNVTPDLRNYIEGKAKSDRVGGQSEGAASVVVKHVSDSQNPGIQNPISESPISDFRNPESEDS